MNKRACAISPDSQVHGVNGGICRTICLLYFFGQIADGRTMGMNIWFFVIVCALVPTIMYSATATAVFSITSYNGNTCSGTPTSSFSYTPTATICGISNAGYYKFLCNASGVFNTGYSDGTCSNNVTAPTALAYAVGTCLAAGGYGNVSIRAACGDPTNFPGSARFTSSCGTTVVNSGYITSSPSLSDPLTCTLRMAFLPTLYTPLSCGSTTGPQPTTTCPASSIIANSQMMLFFLVSILVSISRF